MSALKVHVPTHVQRAHATPIHCFWKPSISCFTGCTEMPVNDSGHVPEGGLGGLPGLALRQRRSAATDPFGQSVARWSDLFVVVRLRIREQSRHRKKGGRWQFSAVINAELSRVGHYSRGWASEQPPN